jgi:signal transduction histidine kinase
MVLYFSLAAFAASLALSVVTFVSTRTYLLSQRSEVAQRQAFNNAQLVRSVISTDRNNVGELITNIRSERGGYAILHIESNGSEGSAFFAQEPLRFTQLNLPTELLSSTLAGSTGRQRFAFDGRPYEGIGVAIPSIGIQYFEAFPLNDVETTLRTIQTTLVIGVLLVTIAAGLLGSSASRNILRPLSRVSAAANDIATGGLDTRLDPEADADLDQLVASFNDMADAVQLRIEREQRFASDVSHELRSPVTALSTAVDVLASRRDEFSERNRQAIDITVSQVGRFHRTVMDLLELSRLDAGASESSLEYLRLTDLLRRIMSRHDFSNIPLVSNIEGASSNGNSEDETLIDRRRVERILLNLLENARDHGHGATQVGLDKEHGFFIITVDDSGSGVAMSERLRIFDRFARGTASPNSTGSGLGLAIVAEHAKALGGNATVETAPSGGARFRISLRQIAPSNDSSGHGAHNA